jgi:hypothetical protein
MLLYWTSPRWFAGRYKHLEKSTVSIFRADLAQVVKKFPGFYGIR